MYKLHTTVTTRKVNLCPCYMDTEATPLRKLFAGRPRTRLEENSTTQLFANVAPSVEYVKAVSLGNPGMSR